MKTDAERQTLLPPETLAVYRVGGLLWLAGGMALVAAGLGILGFLVPTAW
jgi:hypothetical protein